MCSIAHACMPRHTFISYSCTCRVLLLLVLSSVILQYLLINLVYVFIID